MKSKMTFLRAAFVLLIPVLFSCRNEGSEKIQVSVRPLKVFHAEIAQSGGTKVYMDDAAKVFWNAGDQISIFAKNNLNGRYAFQGETGSKTGDFSLVSEPSGQVSSLDKNYAAYPWRDGNSISGDGVLTLTLPASQTWQDGSFDPDAHLMVAVSSSNTLMFKNVGACLGFRLTGSGVSVKSVSVKGNNDELLAGTLLVTAGDSPVCQIVADGASKEVTLTAEAPVVLDAQTPVTFWVVLPPVSFSQGFTLTVSDDEGHSFETTSDRDLNLQRNKAVAMKAIEVIYEQGEVPTKLGIYPAGETAHIYDPAVEQMSVYTAEGEVWVRFVNPAEVSFTEVGPIPATAIAGSSFTASVSENAAGVQQSSTSYQMSVLSISDGIITLASGNSYFVLRF